MNYTQNQKIMQVSISTLVVGIDVGSEYHYARAFDYRGMEFSRSAYGFGNFSDGFEKVLAWINDMKKKNGKKDVIVGMEPTGHYWFCLGNFLMKHDIRVVLVNPHSVKKSKELDDNSPSKNDRKDPKVIAGLVKDGRYQLPYIPDGIYADLRGASNIRAMLIEEKIRIANRIQRWIKIHFPEYSEVYSKFDAKSGLMVLEKAALPSEIVNLGADGIVHIWRDAKLRAAGIDRALDLWVAAKRSIGITVGSETAKLEISILIQDYKTKLEQLTEIMQKIEEYCNKIPAIAKLLEIPGVGIATASTIVAEVGDIRRFDSPKQLQKLAGLEITANSSGKHNGQSGISRRGRKRLRYVLFEVAMALVCKNREFKELHRYYTTRTKNPLKKMQSIMAVACKFMRVAFAVLKKGVSYNPEKMVADIKRPDGYKVYNVAA